MGAQRRFTSKIDGLQNSIRQTAEALDDAVNGAPAELHPEIKRFVRAQAARLHAESLALEGLLDRIYRDHYGSFDRE